MGTNGQSNEKDKDNLLIAVFSIILSVLTSVLFCQNFVLTNISNNIYEKVSEKINEKVKKESSNQIENISRDSTTLIENIKDQAAKNKEFKKEFTESIKPELHDWVKTEVKDYLDPLTKSSQYLLVFLGVLPLLYVSATLLMNRGFIFKLFHDEYGKFEDMFKKQNEEASKKAKEDINKIKDEQASHLEKSREEVTKTLEEVTKKYKLILIKQIKILLSDIRLERLSLEHKETICQEDLKKLSEELKNLDDRSPGLLTSEELVFLGDLLIAEVDEKAPDKITVQAAIKKYRDAAKNLKYPNSNLLESEINYKIGNACAKQSNWEDAIKEYNKIIENPKDPDSKDLNYCWALHWLGYIHHQQRKYQIAIEQYDKAIKKERELPDLERLYQTLYYKGNSLAGLQKYEEAIDCYKEALIIEQHFNWLWHSYGDALRELHRHEEAIEKYKKALECNYLAPKYRAETVSRLGNTYSNLARDTKDKEKQKEYYDQALQYYEYSLMLDPENGTSLYGKGEVHNARHEYDEACKKYKENIDILSEDNTSSRLALNYAYVLEKSGEQNKANSWYIKAFDKAKKDLKEVESLLKDKLVEDPHKYWYLYYNMACYYALRKDIANACRYLKKAQAMKIEEAEDTEKIKALNKIFKEVVNRWARIDFEFDLIREDQRFKDVLEG